MRFEISEALCFQKPSLCSVSRKQAVGGTEGAHVKLLLVADLSLRSDANCVAAFLEANANALSPPHCEWTRERRAEQQDPALLFSAPCRLAGLHFKLDMKVPPWTRVLSEPRPPHWHRVSMLCCSPPPPHPPTENNKNSNELYRIEGGGCVRDGVPVAMAMTMQASTLFFAALRRSTLIAHRVGCVREP